jgi:mannonate dehydratase
MKQTWRWFGPAERVSVDAMLQAGVEGVVTALHHVPSGEIWGADDIRQRMAEIAVMSDGSASGLQWDVVESLPVSEAIKKQQGDWRRHIENYKISLQHIAAAGIEVVCYNFMPLLDWTRTDLAWRLPHGGTCMRFDLVDFAAFDLHVLARADAVDDYSSGVIEQAADRYAGMTSERRQQLAANLVCGLPGAAEHMSLDDVRRHLSDYQSLTADQLRHHFIEFLQAVVPVAESLGLRLCCHPDDPPFALLGLPRIMSTEADYVNILNAVDSPANGITLCAGSLGARPDNDLPGMMRRLGSRVHFLHLRNVKRESSSMPGSFHEAGHLDGDTDMVALIDAVLKEEQRRREAGRPDISIPMRPDHGQDILDDLGYTGQPGYPAIGRLRGLAELRGIMTALSHAPRPGSRSASGL